MVDSTSGPVTPERIMQLAWGYAPPLILEAAVRHRVFDVLDSGAKTIQQLHAETGASERGLTAIANALVGLNFLAKEPEGRYSLTPESAAFLVSSKPAYLGGFLRHGSGHLMPKWLHLNEIVGTGRPVEAVNQEGPGSEFFKTFINDLFAVNFASAQALARHLDLGKAKRPVQVLDLAAGSGVWSITLAQSSENVSATVVDWPGVIPVTRENVGRMGLLERFSFREGDLQDADFGEGYAVATLGHILHSEGRERSKALLAKTFRALSPGATIAVAEFLVNPDRTGPMNGLLFAVNMLVNTDHGDTFSLPEIGGWLVEAGFVNPRGLDVPGPSPLVLATKP